MLHWCQHQAEMKDMSSLTYTQWYDPNTGQENLEFISTKPRPYSVPEYTMLCRDCSSVETYATAEEAYLAKVAHEECEPAPYTPLACGCCPATPNCYEDAYQKGLI